LSVDREVGAGTVARVRGVRRGRLWSVMFLLHQVLGIASGLVVAVVCLTGAILVFKVEIIAAMHPARVHLASGSIRGGTALGVDALADSVSRQSRSHLETVTLYSDPQRPEIFTLANGRRMYVNQYTGRVVDVQRGDERFFVITEAIHRRLLAGEIGRRVVGIATVCFVVILMSGVVIWWPRTMRMLRTRLTFKHPTGWKRRNYDLHVVLGIYSTVILLVVGATGLVWSFRTIGNAVDGMTPRGKATPPPPHSMPSTGGTPISLANAFDAAGVALGPTRTLVLYLPEKPRDAFTVMGLPPDAPYRQAMDIVYLDQFSGRALRVDRFRDRPLGELLRRGTNPVHVGTLYGLPSEIAAFLACLIGTIAPITGLIIWINRRWPRAFNARRASHT